MEPAVNLYFVVWPIIDKLTDELADVLSQPGGGRCRIDGSRIPGSHHYATLYDPEMLVSQKESSEGLRQ